MGSSVRNLRIRIYKFLYIIFFLVILNAFSFAGAGKDNACTGLISEEYPIDWPIVDPPNSSELDASIAAKAIEETFKRKFTDIKVYFNVEKYFLVSDAFAHAEANSVIDRELKCTFDRQALYQLVDKKRNLDYYFGNSVADTQLKQKYLSQGEINLDAIWHDIITTAQQAHGVEFTKESLEKSPLVKVTSKWFRADLEKKGFIAKQRIEISLKEEPALSKPASRRVNFTVDREVRHRRKSSGEWIALADSGSDATNKQQIGNVIISNKTTRIDYPLYNTILILLKED